jgi:hypothetical protein
MDWSLAAFDPIKVENLCNRKHLDSKAVLTA